MIKKINFLIVTLIFILFAHLSIAQPLSFLNTNQSFGNQISEPLDADKAFKNEINLLESKEIEVIFDIEPNYYLYKEKINFKINDVEYKLELPNGKQIVDEFFGESEIFEYGFSFFIKDFPNSKNLNIEINYQGCAKEFNLCYPPVKKEKQIINNFYKEDSFNKGLILDNKNENASIKDLAYTNDTNLIVKYLNNNKESYLIYLTFIVLGIFIAFTPCIYPMMPIIVASTSESKNKLVSSSFYVLGMIFAYSLIGLLSGFLNLNIQILMQNDYIIYFIFIVMIILSLYMAGIIKQILPNNLNNKINNFINKINPNKYRNQVLIGFLSSLVLSPCSIAPLLGVLIFINQMNEPLFGTLLLGSMGLGIGIPLLIISTSFSKILPKNGSWLNEIKNIISLVIFFTALYLISNKISEFYYWMIISFTLFNYGLHLLSFNLKQKIGCNLIILSLLLFYLNLEKNENTYKIEKTENTSNLTEVNYKKISNIEDLNYNIKNANKPIFIDFYADWCVTCVRLEKKVLKDSDIIDEINKNYLMLKIDLSEISKEEKEIMMVRNILAIPYYVFITKDKKEYIYTGDMNKKEFKNLLIKHNEA